jgi:hypothetical protein
MILAAIGFFMVWDFIKNKNIKTLAILVYLLILGFSLENYIQKAVSYREVYSWSWQYGYKEAVTYAYKHYGEYEKILVSKKYGEPHEFFLFYGLINRASWAMPDKYQNDPNLIRFKQSSWFWIDRFDKFYFINDWQVKDLRLESGGEIDCSQKCLLVTSPDNAPGGWTKIETINFLDDTPAFEIYEN